MLKYIYYMSFFGHRKIKVAEELKDRLTVFIENKIVNEDYGNFFFGGFGEFDDLCWEIVTSLKKKYPNIRRIYCLSDERHLRLSKRPKWLKDEDYEEFVYIDLDFDWYYQRIYYRNIEMINKSDFVVFYVENSESSGAYKAMQHAKRKKKDFINIAEDVDNKEIKENE